MPGDAPLAKSSATSGTVPGVSPFSQISTAPGVPPDTRTAATPDTASRATRDVSFAAKAASLAKTGVGEALLRRSLIALAGAVMALGQAPWDLPLVTMATLVLVIARWPGSTGPRAAFGDGWALGVGYFALALMWIVEPFQVDAARHGWMAPFALALMAGGLASFWGCAFALARWVSGRVLGRLTQRGGLACVLLLTACLTGAEVARSLLFTGFPWALIGHIWINTPLAQAAAFIGPFGLTFLTIMTAALAAYGGTFLWVLGSQAGQGANALKARDTPGFFWPAAALLGFVLFGRKMAWQLCSLIPMLALIPLWILLNPGPAPLAVIAAPLIRLVQPNVPQSEKFDPAFVPVHMDRTRDLSGGAVTPALIVWPETAIPWLLADAGPVLSEAMTASGGAPLVLGVQREQAGRYFNSLALIGADGQVAGTYDKAHLVPFGEYIPFGEALGQFGLRGLASSDGDGFSAGAGGTLIDIPGIGLARPLICYEGIFAEVVNSGPRPRLIILITNDAWFGTNIGPWQHLAQARLRAVEQGLPVVRVANTGISAMIDGQGRVLGSLAMNTAGALDLALPPALAPTLYSRTGDWPALAALLLLIGLAIGLRRLGGRPTLDPTPPAP